MWRLALKSGRGTCPSVAKGEGSASAEQGKEDRGEETHVLSEAGENSIICTEPDGHERCTGSVFSYLGEPLLGEGRARSASETLVRSDKPTFFPIGIAHLVLYPPNPRFSTSQARA